jgi:hypothetical protein
MGVLHKEKRDDDDDEAHHSIFSFSAFLGTPGDGDRKSRFRVLEGIVCGMQRIPILCSIKD